MTPSLIAADLCAGSGWAVACAELSITEHGFEIMPEAIGTRDAMGLVTFPQSIAEVPSSFCAGYDLQIAGPPCQTFSSAGGGAGRRALDRVLAGVAVVASGERFALEPGEDERTALVLDPLRLALGGLPTYLAWEQVPPVLPVWEACAVVLRRAGYSAVTGILNAEQYGVPQTRRRAFLIARRDGLTTRMPVPTHSRYWNQDPYRLDEGVLPWMSMAQALGWAGATMISNYGSGGDPQDRGERTTDQPAPTMTSKAGRNKWSHDRPATTVQGDPRIAPPGHHDRQMNNSIRVTVEEAAILQTFPPGHPFQGSKGKQYLQIGNAVPPVLARAVLETFL
jgi:DNA (cytosine-5)-methyltransferase 1